MAETYVVHLTKRCNLNCLYCYENDKSSLYTFQEIQQYVDDIFQDIRDNKVRIEFLGGEPLLEPNLLQKVYYYAESKYSQNILSYIVTTNGTLFSEDLLTFFKKNQERIEIAISMDGTLYANQLRYFKETWKSSYHVVVDNIKKLQRQGIPVSIHIVTHPFNVSFLFDSIRHIVEDLKVTSIGIGTVESTINIDDNYCEEFKHQIQRVSNYILVRENISIDLFDGLKPRSDVRTYVREKKTGKLIFESYGRIENDIFNNEEKYEIIKCFSTSESEKIYSIRKFAYDFHRKNRDQILLKEV